MQNVRTQITLPRDLKERIESQASSQGQSLAEFIRQAATRELSRQDKGLKDRHALADRLIGSLDHKKHPEWSTSEKIYAWSRNIREEWDRETGDAASL